MLLLTLKGSSGITEGTDELVADARSWIVTFADTPDVSILHSVYMKLR